MATEDLAQLKKDAERYRYLREVSRDPEIGQVHCIVITENSKSAEIHLVFDENLDQMIDSALSKEN